MVPQYYSYGSAGMPAVPATIFMSGVALVDVMVKARNIMGWSKLSQEIVFNTTNNINNAIIVVILLLFGLFSGFTNNSIGDSSNVADEDIRADDMKVLIFLVVLMTVIFTISIGFAISFCSKGMCQKHPEGGGVPPNLRPKSAKP